MRVAALTLVVALSVACARSHPAPVSKPPARSVLDELRDDARTLHSYVHTPWVARWLSATDALKSIGVRVVHHDAAKSVYYDEASFAALPQAQRAGLIRQEVSDQEYYANVTSPLEYARAFDLLGEAGLDGVAARRVFDFGYGNATALRMLASLGADANGVEVDPLLPALYSSPGDQGVVSGIGGAPSGKLRLFHGRFPEDAALTSAIASGYDLVISKNTLKNGYLHPERPVEPRHRIDLGVPDEEFVRDLFAMLKPGGLAMLYNICPPPNAPGKPYLPWADGRSPFPQSMLKSAGFVVVAFDRDDSAALHAMGHLLRWDLEDEGYDIDGDRASYTLLRRPLVDASR